jgi:phosphoglycerate dehydrogenase-like enzyme
VTGVWYRGGLRRSLQAGAAASADRRIVGAVLDVFDTEPLPVDHPLRRLDNVVLTPHLGYVSAQNYRAYFVAWWRTSAPSSTASRCGR